MKIVWLKIPVDIHMSCNKLIGTMSWAGRQCLQRSIQYTIPSMLYTIHIRETWETTTPIFREGGPTLLVQQDNVSPYFVHFPYIQGKCLGAKNVYTDNKSMIECPNCGRLTQIWIIWQLCHCPVSLTKYSQQLTHSYSCPWMIFWQNFSIFRVFLSFSPFSEYPWLFASHSMR